MQKNKKMCSAFLVVITLALCYTPQAARYDPLISAQALATQKALSDSEDGQSSKFFNSVMPSNGGANVNMYTTRQMDYMIENRILDEVVYRQDRCQFTEDIEDRARKLNIPEFMFAWGSMLMDGVCVKQDRDLGLEYIKKSAKEAYPPALVRLSFFYEYGYYLKKDTRKALNFMHTAAALGSPLGRIRWAEMLSRGLGAVSQYEEAYRWLYHASYDNSELQQKQAELSIWLEHRIPPLIVARTRLLSYE